MENMLCVNNFPQGVFYVNVTGMENILQVIYIILLNEKIFYTYLYLKLMTPNSNLKHCNFYTSEDCKAVILQVILTWSVSSAPQPQCVSEGRFVSPAPARPETNQPTAVVAASLAVGELSEGTSHSSVSGPGRSLS